jgi:carboxyl-terminal processing protease
MEPVEDIQMNSPAEESAPWTLGGWGRSAIILALVAAISFGAGIAVASTNSGGTSVLSKLPFTGDTLDATPDPTLNLADFWKVYNTLRTQFVLTHASSTIPTEQDMLWGAIKGLTASYGDPYTTFFPPADAKLFSDNISGNFGGVGMEIDIKNGVLTVIAPLKGTPSARAGILAGDQVLAIDGKPTDGISTDAAVKLIRGEKGTSVKFSLMRAGKPLEITVVRDTIEVPEIDNSLDAKTGVYKIALYEFTANSADLFNTAVTAFKKSGSKELIIDLRGNPGGYLDAAVDIASHFLPKGATIVTEDHAGKAANDVHTSLGYNDVPAGTKVAVLIDQGSASASEILAGALQDNHAATLIGTRSFGKGSVQQLVTVDGGSLKITIARWLTPAGHWIMGNGVTPDIEADLSTSDIANHVDSQLARAQAFLTTGK